ncbi:MAG: chemotaxis protein CheX [Candidatus Aureabacteria bacterium]|nr:chemotaxis protein CheX [Candidatus Auribacterota bacterium]
MNIKYFGQFLLEKGHITRDQLLEALKYQKSVNVKLGTLAIDKQYMTGAQVEDVLKTQRIENRPFGEISVAKKYLTRDQLNEILAVQKADRILLGQSLVEKGALSWEQLETYLKSYKDEQEKADKEVMSALSGIPERYKGVVNSVISITQSMLIRMIDENGKVSGCAERIPEVSCADYMVYQKITGDFNGIIGFALRSTTLTLFASRMLKREILSVDEYSKDGVKEFLNIIVGHLCSALSNEGKVTESTPPECVLYDEFISLYDNAEEISVSILMTEDEFEVYFFIPS